MDNLINIEIHPDKTSALYTYLFKEYSPSVYLYGFNTYVDFFDDLNFQDHKIIYKRVSFSENIKEGYSSTYLGNSNSVKKGDLSSDSCVVGLDSKILLYYNFTKEKEYVVGMDGKEVTECQVICYFDNLIYTIREIREIVKDTLSKLKLFDPEIFIEEEIHLLTSSVDGICTTRFSIDKPEIDFNLNYSSDLEKKNEIILELLKGKKGVFMFHGKPGTGKTMYIRHLMSYVCRELKKKVIYIPADNVCNLSGPDFTQFLSENINSVFVIEDGDSHIKQRKTNHSSAVANILNLTDGFLNDCFNIQVIITFNISEKEVDDALLRSGRLLMMHEFDYINAEQATKLSEKLGHNIVYTTPKPLSDVYNVRDNGKNKKQEELGFKIK